MTYIKHVIFTNDATLVPIIPGRSQHRLLRC